MEDQPYTTADEDPFNSVTKRRSSMLDKWILEQQAQSSSDALAETLQLPEPTFPLFPPFASSSNPYLAYPDLPRAWQTTKAESDSASIKSYDLVDDDDIPSTPAKNLYRRHSITPSFRTISLNFRSSAPNSPSTTNMESASRVLSRLSFTTPSAIVESTTTTAPQHARSSSLSTISFSTSQQSNKQCPPASSSSKWRPTVLGHFSQSSTSQISIGTSEANYTPSRPSISSGDTYATSTASRTTTIFDSNIPSTPSKLSLFDSIRLRATRSPRSASAFSVASTSSVQLPASASTQEEGSASATNYSKESVSSRRIPFAPLSSNSVLDNIDDEDDLDPPPTYNFNKHESSRHMASYSSSSTLKRVKFASLGSRSHRKKKKLVISGVGVTEVRKFEGIKRWCESFGEIRQINRMPNGTFKSTSVCRVRAKVFIAGIGSVQLSWIAGNKR
ncbi:hypothetical protein BJ912DRAFT_1018834 [Pholiota molesta]|nr:hypothetical protein BJ912DRAFT_1018834 [Pholiota molesta]